MFPPTSNPTPNRKHPMKTILTLTTFLVLSITSLSAGDTRYFTKFIRASDAPLIIDVPAGLYIAITDFWQSQVQIGENGGVVASKGASPGVLVFSANSDKPVVLAGPITATVNPVPGMTLLITYQLGRN